jgi:hypothetical protein
VNFSGRIVGSKTPVSDGQTCLMVAVNVTAPIVLTLAVLNWNAKLASKEKATAAPPALVSGLQV